MAPQTKSSSTDDSSDDSMYMRHRKKRSAGEGKISRLEKGSEEYLRRRERNNIAVKKSRSKTKQKMQQTLERVNQLRAENDALETKIKLLTKELSFLKDLFLAHAGNAHGQHLTEVDLNFLNNNNNTERAELDLKLEEAAKLEESTYMSQTSK